MLVRSRSNKMYLCRNLLALWWMLQFKIITISSAATTVYIGALFNAQSEDGKVVERAFQLALGYINTHPHILPNTKLDYIKSTSKHLTAFENIQNTCFLVQNGVAAIIGPSSSTSVKATHPICAGLHLIQIAPTATNPTLSLNNQEYPFLLKMSASDDMQSMAIVDLVKHFGWTHFSILASMTEYGRNALNRFQSEAISNKWVLTKVSYFYPVPDPEKLNVNETLQGIKHSGTRIILLTCMAGYAKVILEQAEVLGMTTEGWAWITMDGVTTFEGLYDPSKPVPHHLRGILGTRPAYTQKELFPMYRAIWNDSSSKVMLEGYPMRTFDSVLAFAYGLHDYIKDGKNFTQPDFPSSICQNTNATPWRKGEDLFDYIAKTRGMRLGVAIFGTSDLTLEADGPGVMNHINFTSKRTPVLTDFDIVNLRIDGWKHVAAWSPATENQPSLEILQDIVFLGNTQDPPNDNTVDLANTTLRVVTIMEEPYLMETNKNERKLQPNVLYKGYCIDLLDKLKEELSFNYKVSVVSDGNYGAQDPITGRWNGMVGELIYEKADAIVASLTISSNRQKYIDYTVPYQDLGLIILMAKEAPKLSILTFLEPFGWELWSAVVAAFLTSGISITICSYFSPYGYRGRQIQDTAKSRQPKETKKDFRLFDSLWYAYSAWMAQSSDVFPGCFSGRLIQGFWLFAVMVISATYTANLAAILTVERLDTGISSLDDLGSQRHTKYGTVSNTFVETFFEEQLAEPFTRMARLMKTEKTNVPTTAIGIEQVQRSYGLEKGDPRRFALIFDSAPLEYIANKKPCHMRLAGRLFSNFGYGLAFPKNSPLTDLFSIHILKLREKGILEAYWARWSRGSCPDRSDSTVLKVKGEQTSLQSMTGVFYMLVVGIVSGFCIIIIEFCVASYRESALTKRQKNQETRSCFGAMSRRCQALASDMCCRCCEEHTTVDADEDSINSQKLYRNNIQESRLGHHNCANEISLDSISHLK